MNTATKLSGGALSVVKSIYANFSQGNIPAVLECLDADVAWKVHGPLQYPFFGEFRGHAGFQKFLAGLGEATEIKMFEPQRFLESDDTVIVTGREAGCTKRARKSYDTTWCHIFTVRGGKVVAFEEFIDSAPLVAAYS